MHMYIRKEHKSAFLNDSQRGQMTNHWVGVQRAYDKDKVWPK